MEGVLSEDFKKSVALSLKSNVINALQVATRDFHGFGVMYGNRLIDPVRVRRENIESLNIFAASDGKYAGRVEFGISLNQSKKIDKEPKHYQTFSRRIAILDSALLTVDDLKTVSAEAVIIKIRENERLPDDIVLAVRHLKQPVILYNFWYVLEHPGLVTVARVTESSLLAKVMWLLAQHPSRKDFEHLIMENVIGEILS
jgi:L-asparaginase/Glu-tRNA(Gln) amidotransferase subunit D